MKNKYFLLALLVPAVVGGVIIKNSIASYNSAPVSKLKSSYKEDVIDNMTPAMFNSDINKNEQISTSSTKQKKNNSKSTTKTKEVILKSNDTNNIQIDDKKSSVSTTIGAKQAVKDVESNKVQAVNIPTETAKTTKRVEVATTITSTSKISSPTETAKATKKVDEVTTTTSTSKINPPTIHYDRTTKIYDNDKITLLRVEYYSNNKLIYYSDIEQFNVATNSYIEKIYQWDNEKDIEVLIRTDIYTNGKLVNSY